MRAAPLDFLRNGKSRNITLHHPRPTGLMRAELVAFDIGKVEILQYYGGRAGQYIATAFGFPLFLAELVVSGIGKVEKLQYYLIPCERKSRNITNLTHGIPGPHSPTANGKTEILQI